jgi:hypothetical protein
MAQHRLNYHHLISQSAVSTAGSPLTNAMVDAQSQLYYRYLPGFRRAYARVRRLSMLRYFLRKQGIRDLSLPAAVLPVLAANVPRYQVFPAAAWALVTSSGGVSGHADRSCSATSVTPRTTSGISRPAAALVNGEGQPRRTASGARL